MTEQTITIGKDTLKKLEEACRTHPPKYKEWSEEEVEILKRYYGKMTNAKLSEILGREGTSIMKKHYTLMQNKHEQGTK